MLTHGPSGQCSDKQVENNRGLMYVHSVLSLLRLVRKHQSVQFFSTPSLFVLTFAEAAGAADQIEVTGEVGGSVAINCPTIPNKAIVYFYFQKKVERIEDKFVNGFYTGHANERPPKPNSRLDAEKNTTVHLFNLTMVDDGAYECLLEYTDGRKDTNVYVHVTGKKDRLLKPLGVFFVQRHTQK